MTPATPASRHFTAVLMLLGTAFFWSLGGLLIKWVPWNPMAIAGSRSLIAALFLLLATGIPRLEWSWRVVGGALFYSATVILFVCGNKLTTAANVILLQYSAPIYIALLSPWLLKEKIRMRDWMTIAVVLAGMVLFFLDELAPGNFAGNLCGIISGFTFSCMILCLRKQKDASPVTSVILGNLLTGLIGIPFMLGGLPGAKGCAGLLLLGVVQLGLSYFLYTKAIKRVTALEGILIPVIEPILNPIWVLIFLSEVPGPWSIAGGAIILAAITWRYVGEALKSKVPENA